MIKSESLVNLTKALIAVKKIIRPVVRNSDNPFLSQKNDREVRYADLAAVIEAVDPILSENGLAVSQLPCNDGDRVGVWTLLLHESGEFIGESYSIPLAKNDAQTATAGITYARRAGLKAVVGIAETDDDGNQASGNVKEKELTKSTARPVNPPKAEIPNDQSAAAKTANSSDSGGANETLPSSDELDAYRTRFGKLVDALSTAGLKSSKGLPLQKKVLAYLLSVTSAPKPEDISKQRWEVFFEEAAKVAAAEDGMKLLVGYVNSAVGGTK